MAIFIPPAYADMQDTPDGTDEAGKANIRMTATRSIIDGGDTIQGSPLTNRVPSACRRKRRPPV